jgi:hypothetical protein
MVRILSGYIKLVQFAVQWIPFSLRHHILTRVFKNSSETRDNHPDDGDGENVWMLNFNLLLTQTIVREDFNTFILRVSFKFYIVFKQFLKFSVSFRPDYAFVSEVSDL